MRKNETWDLVVLLDVRRTISSKHVLKNKTNEAGHVEKFKAWLVAKGYLKVEGVDFGEIFSPLVILTFIRLLMSLAIAFDLEIEQIYVKTTFIHGYLEEKIDMKKPKGFTMKGKEKLVCKL